MTTSVTLISGLVLLAVVLFMAAALISVVGHVAPEDNSRRQAAALERIKPVARVSFEQPKPAVAVKLSGAEVYNKVCAACHAAGTLGAPKVGDKAQWETRLAQGLDTLVTHSVNGLRAMPAKGGDPSLTEANLKDAIGYMLDQTGIKTEASATAPAPAAAAPAPAAAAPAPAVTAAPAKPTAAVAPPPAQPAVTAAPAKTATAPVIPPPPIQVPKATPPAFIQGAPVPAK
jgi:cytochrome c5